jgi:hypothetical protein
MGRQEADAELEIYNYQLSVLSNLVLDAVGVFTHNVDLILGENSFNLTSNDIVDNIISLNFKYYKENEIPEITITSPATNINTRQPVITLGLTDFGFNNGTDYISGIDLSSVQLFLKHSDFAEDQIVTNGASVSPLGSVQTDCNTTGSLGNSGPPNCNFSFVFETDLAPDGNYLIRAEAKDKAGNTATSEGLNFELDSHTINTISTPTNGQLFNYSLIELTGTAEKGTVINITNNHGTDNITFVNVETQDLASLQPPPAE